MSTEEAGPITTEETPEAVAAELGDQLSPNQEMADRILGTVGRSVAALGVIRKLYPEEDPAILAILYTNAVQTHLINNRLCMLIDVWTGDQPKPVAKP